MFSIDFGGKAGVAVVDNFHAILFPFDLGNTGNMREHLVTITWQFVSNYPVNPPVGSRP